MASVGGSTFVEEEFLVGSFTILEVKISISRLESFFPSISYRILVLILLSVPEILKLNCFKKYTLPFCHSYSSFFSFTTQKNSYSITITVFINTITKSSFFTEVVYSYMEYQSGR